MNLNNKFGECCNCPALMDDSRLFTSYVPRRDYNALLMKDTQLTNSIDYKNMLQQNGAEIIASIQRNLNTNFRCTTTGNNQFYVVPDVNAYFDNLLFAELQIKNDFNNNI